MNKYLFKTHTTMKPYNKDNWWITRDIVPQTQIEAEDLKAALLKFVDFAKEHGGITISKNALKLKQPMFRDRADGGIDQVGYVITGSSDFQDDNYRWSKQYVDLWVEISGIVRVFK